MGGVLAGSAESETFANYLKTNLPDLKTYKIYFDYGKQTLDAMYLPQQKKVDEVMKAKDFTSQNRISREFPGEYHSEKAWNKGFSIPVLFLLEKYLTLKNFDLSVTRYPIGLK